MAFRLIASHSFVVAATVILWGVGGEAACDCDVPICTSAPAARKSTQIPKHLTKSAVGLRSTVDRRPLRLQETKEALETKEKVSCEPEEMR